MYYDKNVKNQADVDNKYGAKSGVRYIADGSTLTVRMGDEISARYSFYNDHESNKYGTIRDMNGNLMDNSKIIYGLTYTIFGTTDESCNAETLHKNFFGSYTGSNNPRDYLDYDSYRYHPRNPSEYGSILHDKMYDFAEAKGHSDAFLNTRVWEADAMLACYNLINAKNPNTPVKDRLRSAGTTVLFSIIATYKFILEEIK